MSRVCVYCGSSDEAPTSHLNMAYQLGERIAENGLGLVYGGGAKGLMKQVADGAMAKGGHVQGIIPGFMIEREWEHKGISELIKVDTMAQRKAHFIASSDYFVVLPGGSGTLEELYETMSLTKLEQATGRIILFNFEGFYDQLVEFMDNVVDKTYLSGDFWTVTTTLDETVAQISM